MPELSTPVLHFNNMGIVAVITIPYSTTDLVSDNGVEVVDDLLSAATVLGERIGITIPNLIPPKIN